MARSFFVLFPPPPYPTCSTRCYVPSLSPLLSCYVLVSLVEDISTFFIRFFFLLREKRKATFVVVFRKRTKTIVSSFRVYRLTFSPGQIKMYKYDALCIYIYIARAFSSLRFTLFLSVARVRYPLIRRDTRVHNARYT